MCFWPFAVKGHHGMGPLGLTVFDNQNGSMCLLDFSCLAVPVFDGFHLGPIDFVQPVTDRTISQNGALPQFHPTVGGIERNL